MLAVSSNNLDKEDFLDSSYFVDEAAHLEKGMKEVTASGRGGSSSEKEKKPVVKEL